MLLSKFLSKKGNQLLYSKQNVHFASRSFAAAMTSFPGEPDGPVIRTEIPGPESKRILGDLTQK